MREGEPLRVVGFLVESLHRSSLGGMNGSWRGVGRIDKKEGCEETSGHEANHEYLLAVTSHAFFA